MRIAMFGGSFDPVHNDHIALCRLMSEKFALDKVYVFPAFCSPFKAGTGSDALHRFQMCKEAFAQESNVIVPDYEIKRGGKSYTVDTLRHLRSLHPESQLFLIMGADAFLTLSAWFNAEEIFALSHILTVVRGKDNYDALLRKEQEYKSFSAKCSFVDTPVGEISSSMIRQLISEKQDVRDYLPEKVYDYIKLNRLYGYGN